MDSHDEQKPRLLKKPYWYQSSSGRENDEEEPKEKKRVMSSSPMTIEHSLVAALSAPASFSEFVSQRNENLQNQVLLKLDTILENQAEQLCLLRTLVRRSAVNNDLEDVLPTPISVTEELDELCHRISTDNRFKKKMISCLCCLGGRNVGDSIRRMMRRLGTNALWSKYSLKGRKGKMALIELSLFMVLTRSCLKCHPRAKVPEIEGEIAETLKHAPNKRGGANYKEHDPRTVRENMQPNQSVSSSGITCSSLKLH